MLSIVMVLGMCSFASAEAIYTPGTYEASVNGMNGPVVVKMEFNESAILSVTAVGEKETKGLGDVAIDKLIPLVMEKQSAEVDAVAGATVTSNAMLQAVQSCIDQAKGIAADDAVETEVTADVIVVGAGASGLAAASAVVEQGASVIVLEANSFLGGAADTSMDNILYLDQEAFAQMDRYDAALAKYAGNTVEQFPEPWKSDYIKLIQYPPEVFPTIHLQHAEPTQQGPRFATRALLFVIGLSCRI